MPTKRGVEALQPVRGKMCSKSAVCSCISHTLNFASAVTTLFFVSHCCATFSHYLPQAVNYSWLHQPSN